MSVYSGSDYTESNCYDKKQVFNSHYNSHNDSHYNSYNNFTITLNLTLLNAGGRIYVVPRKMLKEKVANFL